jgi:hypothetical protein
VRGRAAPVLARRVCSHEIALVEREVPQRLVSGLFELPDQLHAGPHPRGREPSPQGRCRPVYNPATNTWRNHSPYPGPSGEQGQFLLRPFGAVRVFFEGAEYLFAVGSGHLYADDTVKPAGTIDPGPPYILTP